MSKGRRQSNWTCRGLYDEAHLGCEPSRAIPVLEIHGTVDDVTLVEGDVDNSEGWGAYMPLNDTIQFWVSHNGLTESEVTDITDIDASDGSTVRYHRYYSSSTSTEVWLYEVIDGGHDLPRLLATKISILHDWHGRFSPST